MGKHGKAKKKQRLMQFTQESVDNDIEIMKPENIDETIRLFHYFSNNIEIYQSPSVKPFRIALYPLIIIQKTKFFEKMDIVHALSDISFDNDYVNHLPEKISKSIEVLNYLSSDVSIFQSLEYKSFRKSMHPLVLYTNQKEKLENISKIDGNQSISTNIKSTHAKKSSSNQSSSMKSVFSLQSMIAQSQSKRTSINDSRDTSNSSQLLLTSLFDDNNDSNRPNINQISSSLRYHEYDKALQGLYEILHNPSQHLHHVKLGALQRWVRECDVESKLQVPEVSVDGKNDGVVVGNDWLDSSEKVIDGAATDENRVNEYTNGNDDAVAAADISDNPVTVHHDNPINVTLDSSRDTGRGSALIAKTCSEMSKYPKETIQNISWLLLDAVLRVMCLQRDYNGSKGSVTSSHANQRHYLSPTVNLTMNPSTPSALLSRKARLIEYPLFSVKTCNSSASVSSTPVNVSFTKDNILVISHIPAIQRRPLSKYDLNIYSITSNIIDFSTCKSS